MSKRIPNGEFLKQISDPKLDYQINQKLMRPGEAFAAIISSYHLIINTQRDEPIGVIDSHHAGRVIDTIFDPIIELEDADYEWLKKVIETYAPRMLGAVGGEILIRAVNKVSNLEAKTK